MANGLNNDYEWPRPDWLPSIEEYRTPEEDWSSFLATQQPFWSVRTPMEDIGRRAAGRYLLAAPYMAQAAQTPSFSGYLSEYTDYLGGRGAWEPSTAQGALPIGQHPYIAARGTAADLRNRALQAAEAATTDPGVYMAGAPPGEEGTPERERFNRRAWYTSQFGPGAQQAQSNQMAVANLLALQRKGGGVYQGQMADAIRNAMYRLAEQRVNIGKPRETFLDWYLGQTGAPRTQVRGTPTPLGMSATTGTFETE